MVASAPEIENPLADTALPVPTFLSANEAPVYEGVTSSPATSSSVSVTAAAVVVSYSLFTPVAVTCRSRAVMSANVVLTCAE